MHFSCKKNRDIYRLSNFSPSKPCRTRLSQSSIGSKKRGSAIFATNPYKKSRLVPVLSCSFLKRDRRILLGERANLVQNKVLFTNFPLKRSLHKFCLTVPREGLDTNFSLERSDAKYHCPVQYTSKRKVLDTNVPWEWFIPKHHYIRTVPREGLDAKFSLEGNFPKHHCAGQYTSKRKVLDANFSSEGSIYEPCLTKISSHTSAHTHAQDFSEKPHWFLENKNFSLTLASILDRKTLTQPGLYLILCTKNNVVYIGESQNVHGRFKRHRSSLRRNKGDSIPFQKDWNKFGEKNFQFYTLCLGPEYSEKAERKKLEDEYVDQHKKGNKKSYNVLTKENLGERIGKSSIVEVFGVTYLTIREAAKATGISDSVISRKVRYGTDPNFRLIGKRNKSGHTVMVNGVVFNSLKEVVDAGLVKNRHILSYRLNSDLEKWSKWCYLHRIRVKRKGKENKPALPRQKKHERKKKQKRKKDNNQTES